MNRLARVISGLIAIAAATAVGVTTQRAGFTIITFVGTLVLPRMVGLGGHGGHWAGGCVGRQHARSHLEERLAAWHRDAHGETSTDPGVSAGASA